MKPTAFLPDIYTVEYDGNRSRDASTQLGQMPTATSCEVNESFSLPTAPYLSGYTFSGWYKESDCKTKVGDAGQTIEKANLINTQGAVVKLYAKRIGKAATTVTVE